MVITTYPLKNILHKPELFSQLTKWAVELSEYDISFQPCTSINSQALADFIPNAQAHADKELLNLTQCPSYKWMHSIDGGSNMNGIGIGLVLTSPEGDVI